MTILVTATPYSLIQYLLEEEVCNRTQLPPHRNAYLQEGNDAYTYNTGTMHLYLVLLQQGNILLEVFNCSKHVFSFFEGYVWLGRRCWRIYTKESSFWTCMVIDHNSYPFSHSPFTIILQHPTLIVLPFRMKLRDGLKTYLLQGKVQLIYWVLLQCQRLLFPWRMHWMFPWRILHFPFFLATQIRQFKFTWCIYCAVRVHLWHLQFQNERKVIKVRGESIKALWESYWSFHFYPSLPCLLMEMNNHLRYCRSE